LKGSIRATSKRFSSMKSSGRKSLGFALDMIPISLLCIMDIGQERNGYFGDYLASDPIGALVEMMRVNA